MEPAGDKTVPGGAEMIKKLTFPQLFPETHQESLLHTAVLNCHDQVCELVLEVLEPRLEDLHMDGQVLLGVAADGGDQLLAIHQ